MKLWQKITFDCAKCAGSGSSAGFKNGLPDRTTTIANNLVDWGIAFKRGNSKQFTYLIYPKKFYETTGFCYQGGVSGE